MAQIAREELDKGDEGDRALALHALKELAAYVAPKRKAVEVSGAEGRPVRFQLILNHGEDGNPTP